MHKRSSNLLKTKLSNPLAISKIVIYLILFITTASINIKIDQGGGGVAEWTMASIAATAPLFGQATV